MSRKIGCALNANPADADRRFAIRDNLLKTLVGKASGTGSWTDFRLSHIKEQHYGT
jgi:hypothetical protein